MAVRGLDRLKSKMLKPFRHLLLVFGWAVSLFFVGQNIGVLPPWAVLLGVVVFSVPMALFSLYLSTVRKIRNLAGIAPAGWLYRLLGGRLIATFFWIVASVVTTFVLLLQFRTYTTVEWLGFFAVVPLFYGVYWVLHRALRSELKPYLHVAEALRLARFVTPFLAVVVYFMVLQVSGGLPEVWSLGEAVELRRGELVSSNGSALVVELAHLVAFYDGARLFVASQIGAEGWALAYLVFGVCAWLVFFNAASLLSSFFVPRHEYRRLFARLSDADEPPPVEVGRVFISSAIATFVLLFIAVPTFNVLEQHARQQGHVFSETRLQLETVVVLIDGHPYRPGVVQAISDLKLDIARQLDDLQPQLVASLHSGFDQLEENVEPFLDWYYQLSSEYLRGLNLMRGGLEDYVGNKLEGFLQQDNPFGEFESLLAEAIALREDLETRFAAESAVLLERYRLTLPDEAPHIVAQEFSLEGLINLPAPDEIIGFGTRVGAGGAAGAVTTLIVAKVVSKLYAKGLLKLAIQPLAKALLTRTSVLGLSTVAGGGIGSVVPGLGTAVGAGVGAVVGLIAGVVIDYGLLKLEEQLSRDSFREQLIETIREAREEFLGEINPGNF
jgi:hypothetical protein